MSAEGPIQVSFQSELANVLFGSAADPTRERQEVELVQRFVDEVASATSLQIFKIAPYVDAMLVPHLSGRNRLAVAKLIETRSPAAIENMPNLRRQREHLRRSAEFAKILSPQALELMIAALQADAKHRKGA
ncbi:hypothetical protein [Ramlibacter sp. AN1133]|uniref:hypothetical protein n=1 Tax=Ramlibacter sp. AN1133 TaxID=3133429 RepID=UPI0030BCCE32